MERVLGKSPLRLISVRKQLSKGCWLETLACGHTVTTYQDFLWDEGGHLVLLEPTAKRRRCRKCKELAEAELFTAPRKPVQPVTLDEEKKRREERRKKTNRGDQAA